MQSYEKCMEYAIIIRNNFKNDTILKENCNFILQYDNNCVLLPMILFK